MRAQAAMPVHGTSEVRERKKDSARKNREANAMGEDEEEMLTGADHEGDEATYNQVRDESITV